MNLLSAFGAFTISLAQRFVGERRGIRLENLRRLKLRMRDYLAAILPGLADLAIKRLAGLTAATWAAKRSQLFETRQS